MTGRPAKALIAAAVALTVLPAVPVRAEDVEMQSVCGQSAKKLEYWAEAKRRHSTEGALTVTITADFEGRGWQTIAEHHDSEPSRAADGSASNGPQTSVWTWSVPDPGKDGAFRRTQTTNKPAARGYRMRVVFNASDAHLEDTASCDNR